MKITTLSEPLQVKYNNILTKISRVLPGANITLKAYTISLSMLKENVNSKLILMLKEKEAQEKKNHMIIVEKRTRGEVFRTLISILSTYFSYSSDRRLLLIVKEPHEIDLVIKGLVNTYNKGIRVNIYFLKRERLKNLRVLCPHCLSPMRLEGGSLKTLTCRKCNFSSEKIGFSAEELSIAHIIITSISDLIEWFMNRKALKILNNVNLILTIVLKHEDIVAVELTSLLLIYCKIFIKSKVKALALISSSDKMLLLNRLQILKESLLKIRSKRVFSNKILVTITIKTAHLTTPLLLELIKCLVNQSSKDLFILMKDKQLLSLVERMTPNRNVKTISVDEIITLNYSTIDTIITLGFDESRILKLLTELEILNDIITVIIVLPEDLMAKYYDVRQRAQMSITQYNTLSSLITLLMLYDVVYLDFSSNESDIRPRSLTDAINQLAQIALSKHYFNLLTLTLMDEGQAKAEFVKLIKALQKAKFIAELLTNERTLSSVEKMVNIANTQTTLSLCLDRLSNIIETLKRININKVKGQLVSVLSNIRSSFYVNTTDEEIILVCREFIDNVHSMILKMRKLSELILELSRLKEYEFDAINKLLNICLPLSKEILRHIKLLNIKLTCEFDRKAHPSVITEVVTTMRIYHMMRHRQLSNLITNLISAYSLMINITNHLKTIEDNINSMSHEMYEKLRLITEYYKIPTHLLITIASNVYSHQTPIAKAMYLLTYILESEYLEELIMNEPQWQYINSF